MKKFILLMCALMTFYFEGHAQWELSAIAGPQLATFGGKDKKYWGGTESDPEMVARFHAGLLAERRQSEHLAFLAGLLFSSKGTRYSGEITDFATNQQVEIAYAKMLSYLDLPLLLRYYHSEKWSFLFGPQISYLISAKVKNNDNAQRLYELPAKEDVKDYYTKFDAGLNLGVAYNINERMALMLLFQYGILKIGIDEVYNNNGSFEKQKAAVMNRLLLLSLIYKLHNK